MLGNFKKIYYIVVCFLKPVNSACFFMGNDRLSGKQVGSQASRGWPGSNLFAYAYAVPALKGLILTDLQELLHKRATCCIAGGST